VIPFDEIYRQARALLASLGIDLAPDTIAGTLSSLDTHLVEIAKAIHHGASAIVMDDVTDDYSPRDFEKIQEFLHARCLEGVSFLFTTRRVEAAMALCDRITILRNGTTVRTLHRDEFSRQKLVNLLIGHSYEESFNKSPAHPGAEVLRVEQLSNGSLLRGVDLCLHAGEVLSLLDIDGGLSSQLVQVLTGEQKVIAGAIYLAGRKTHLKNYRDAVRQGIGLVPETWSTHFFANLSLADNLAFLVYRKMSPGLMLVNPHLLKFAHQNFDEAFNPQGQPLNIANLKEVGHAERLKILMYRWMIRRPLALIINKPSLHIDLVVRQCLYRLIEALSKEGIGILLVATDLAEAAAISDRTIVIQNGAVHGEYSYRQVQEISLEDVA
jgi:ribose transport system ATP-binding protein